MVDLERHQVALVDADEGGTHGDGPVELGLVVHLDQDVEAHIDGDGVELVELTVVERGQRSAARSPRP